MLFMIIMRAHLFLYISFCFIKISYQLISQCFHRCLYAARDRLHQLKILIIFQFYVIIYLLFSPDIASYVKLHLSYMYWAAIISFLLVAHTWPCPEQKVRKYACIHLLILSSACRLPCLFI